MELDLAAHESAMLEGLRREAAATFGAERAGQMEERLRLMARWLSLVAQQPLDLLDEEPDGR